MLDETQRQAIIECIGGEKNVGSETGFDDVLVVSVKDQGLVDLERVNRLDFVGSAALKTGTLRISFPTAKGIDMAGKYHDLAAAILENVGGKDNVNSVAHCITRLRFKLKDENRANTEAITGLEGVIQVMQAGGQYQVVVGAKVDDVYKELVESFGLGAAGEVAADDEPSEKKDRNLFNMFMDTVSGSMAPILMPFAAAGVIKGLLSLATAAGWVTATDGAYQVWWAIADGFFYFLPIILGYTAAKKFGCSEFTGMALGAALTYPAMVNLTTTSEVLGTVLAGTPFEMSYYTTFFGIPVIMPASGYTSSVFPILISVWVASKVERGLNRMMPDLIRSFAVPVITFALMSPLTYLVIGPAASLISGVLSMIVSFIYGLPVVGPALIGLVIGGFFSTLVMFGLHWAVIPIMLNNIATIGFDPLMAAGSVGGFVGTAQGLAVILRTKDDKRRNIAIPATISQFFGVGEPLLYGLQIPTKFLFVQNIFFSAIGGLAMGIMNVHAYAMGSAGLFGIPTFIPTDSTDMSNVIFYVAILVIIMVVSFVFTMATYHDDGSYFGTKKAK